MAARAPGASSLPRGASRRADPRLGRRRGAARRAARARRRHRGLRARARGRVARRARAAAPRDRARRRHAAAAAAALAPDDDAGAADLVGSAERAVAPLERLAPELAAAGEALRAPSCALRETSSDLRSFLASLEAQPDRVEAVEAELDRIADARRRYRAATYDELLERAEDARPSWRCSNGGHDLRGPPPTRSRRAQAEVDRMHRAPAGGAAADAPRFAEAVAVELAGVGFGRRRVPRRAPRGRAGRNPAPTRSTFLVRPNTGLPFDRSPRPHAVATVPDRACDRGRRGGETIVFDEIDAGIGGQTGHAVGETLRRLAERAQVVTITHLPQIASLADRHFRVEKVAGDPTHTRIEALDAADRREELERMLGGGDFLATLRD